MARLELLFARIGGIPIRARIGVPVAILILLVFVDVGVDMIVRPRRHMNIYLQRGGKMLRDWNELQMQACGLIFSCVSGWMLYELAKSVAADWLN